jgi:poly(A) polymerase
VLRILRFFRFHAHYGRGAPDSAALAACQKTASLLPTLSGERVAAELRRLLEAPDAAGIIAEMRARGILAPILPELDNIDRLRRLQAVPEPPARDAVLRLAALLPREGTVAAAVAERLRLSNAERERLRLLAEPPALWPAADPRALKRALYHLGAEIVRDLGLLAWADGDAAQGRTAFDAAACWTRLTLPVRGQDALDLGVAAGPEVGRLMTAVEAWWEDRDYQPDRAACLARLKELIGAKT